MTVSLSGLGIPVLLLALRFYARSGSAGTIQILHSRICYPQTVKRPSNAARSRSNVPFIRSRWLLVKPVMSMPHRIQLCLLALALFAVIPCYAADPSAVGAHGMVVSESEDAARA